jgi:hypothetical protein
LTNARLYLRFLKRRGEILPPREAILKALMSTYLEMAFASQEVQTIASRQEEAEKTFTNMLVSHTWPTRAVWSKYERRTAKQTRANIIRHSSKTGRATCQIYFDTRQERVKHSLSHITSCVEMSHECYTLKFVSCIELMWKVIKKVWHKFNDVTIPKRKKKTVHGILNLDRQHNYWGKVAQEWKPNKML